MDRKLKPIKCDGCGGVWSECKIIEFKGCPHCKKDLLNDRGGGIKNDGKEMENSG